MKVIVVLLLLGASQIAHGYKYGVNCSAAQVALDTPKARPYNLLAGGRDIADCDVTCAERILDGVVCYSDVTWQYDLWWWLLLLGFTGVGVWSSYCLWIMKRMESTGKIVLNPTFIVAIFNIVTVVIRLVFVSTMYNGRTLDVLVGGPILSAFLIQFGQCVMFAELFLIILVWSTVVKASSKMKAMDKNVDRNNYIKTVAVIGFVFVILLPLNIASYVGYLTLGLIGNVIQLILVLMLIGGGVRYALMLRQLLVGGITDTKKRNAVQGIMFTVYACTILAVITTLGVIGNTLSLFTEPHVKVWCWWFLIHACEMGLLITLVSSTSYKARAAAKIGRTADKYFDNSTKKSNASESEKESTASVSSPSSHKVSTHKVSAHKVSTHKSTGARVTKNSLQKSKPSINKEKVSKPVAPVPVGVESTDVPIHGSKDNNTNVELTNLATPTSDDSPTASPRTIIEE